MKIPTACRQCRESKRKCKRRGPGQSCNTCHQRGLECDGHLGHHRHGYRRPLVPGKPFSENPDTTRALGHSADQGDLDLPNGIAIELVEHYLAKIHDRPHSLFHPPTLRAQVRDGAVKKVLLYAICALGAKFSVNPDARRWEARLAAESKRLLQADLENICLESIQTCLLIATLNLGNGNTSSEALFFGIATTMSDIMCLNSPITTGSMIARETRQRVWWSLYTVDLWCISGLGLPSHMKHLPIMIERPMDESRFISLTPDQTSLSALWKPGLWAHMTTLVQLFNPIQDLNRRAVNGDVSATRLSQEVTDLAQQLENWCHMLPSDAQMNPKNLLRQQERGLGGLLISTHLAYHHYSTLLYFGFLENQQAPSSTDSTYIRRCKWHASCFSALICKSRQLKGCEALYPLVGHMTTVSSLVLLHTLLFGEIDELKTARQELNANFEALIELKQYWPATSAWIDRLILFQNTCLLSTDPKTHRLDGWMLRLLIEHSLALEAKPLSSKPNSTMAPPESIASKAKQFAEMGRYMDFHE